MGVANADPIRKGDDRVSIYPIPPSSVTYLAAENYALKIIAYCPALPTARLMRYTVSPSG